MRNMTRKKEKPEWSVKLKYETIGRCGGCLLHIEAKQPGGIDVRHVATLLPLCKETRK